MAMSQSALSELLDAFRAGEGVDLIRESVRMVMQELIEAEATERIGASRHERAESCLTDRNGSRPRLLATRAGPHTDRSGLRLSVIRGCNKSPGGSMRFPLRRACRAAGKKSVAAAAMLGGCRQLGGVSQPGWS